MEMLSKLPFFLFSQKYIHTMIMHIKFLTTSLLCIKTYNLTPWQDSNPVSSLLEADAMTTMPRRQGFHSFLSFPPQWGGFILLPQVDDCKLEHF
jgi:hypothetical protein